MFKNIPSVKVIDCIGCGQSMYVPYGEENVGCYRCQEIQRVNLVEAASLETYDPRDFWMNRLYEGILFIIVLVLLAGLHWHWF